MGNVFCRSNVDINIYYNQGDTLIDPDKLKKMLEKQKANKIKSFEKHKAKQSNKFRQRDFLDEMRFSNRSGSHTGCFRGAPGAETDEHLDMKYNIWKQLKKWGHEVMTEVIFTSGKRADVIDLTEGIIYEVLHTETLQDLKKKVEGYPEIFEIRHVKSGQPFKEELLL